MNRKRFALLLLTALAGGLLAVACRSDPQQTRSDQAELVRLTLERALTKGALPDYVRVSDLPEVILSSENIEPAQVPELPGIRFQVLSPVEIQSLANQQGDLLALHFSQISINGSQALVSLDNTWVQARNSEHMFMHGGGITIEFHKRSGGWEGKLVRSWVY